MKNEKYLITVANTKGGCGKTTIALNLASGFAVKGVPVALLDNHGQQSAHKMWDRANDENFSLPFDTIPFLIKGDHYAGKTVQAYKDAVANLDEKLIILDTPIRDADESLVELFYISDLVLVPFMSWDLTSVDAMEEFIGLLSIANDARLLANRAPINIKIVLSQHQDHLPSTQYTVKKLHELLDKWKLEKGLQIPILSSSIDKTTGFVASSNTRRTVFHYPKAKMAKLMIEGLMAEISVGISKTLFYAKP